MLTLALTGVWLAASLVLAHALTLDGLAARGVFAGTLATSGIVACVLVLGATAQLTRPALVTVSLVSSGAILAVALRRLGGRVGAALALDFAAVRRGTRAFRDPAVGVVAVAAAALWLWALAAIAWLPPRSVDDLSHHLSPVFEAIARRRFVILPLDLKPWFAYPLNGDLLALWTSLLERDIAWADGAQAATAVLAALAVTALARELGASHRSALLAAGLFLVMPITLKQGTSAYTDVTAAAAWGAAAWGAVRWARAGTCAALLACGLATGLVAGMRYHFLFPLLAIVPVVLLGLVRHTRGARAGAAHFLLAFALPATALAGYWYVRNLLALGNPFFPFRLGVGALTLFPSGLPLEGAIAQSPPFVRVLLQYPLLGFAVSLRDLGVGGVDGGFGAVFWGAVVPIGALAAARAAWRARADGATPTAVAAALFGAACLPYVMAPAVMFEVQGRYLLWPAVIGFAVLAAALDVLRRDAPRAAAAATVAMVITALVGAMPIAAADDPHARKQLMRLAPVRAAREDDVASPWRFVTTAAYGVGPLATTWDLLDVAGRVRPLWIYATGSYPAGFYGTHLENRIWNLGAPERPPHPDALVYVAERPGDDGILYYGDAGFRRDDAVGQLDLFDPVLVTATVSVFFRREVVSQDEALRARIARWLGAAYPDAVALAETLAPRPTRGTIVASGPLALGLKALELRGALGARVVPAQPGDAARLVTLARDGGPVLVAGRTGQPAQPVATLGGEFRLYEVAP